MDIDNQELVTDLAAESDEMRGKYLTFWIDKQLFAVPIAVVEQIISIQPITEIPEYPRYAKGIINLRGIVVPIIDVRIRLDREEIPYDDHTCIIVTNINGTLVGFVVDSVDEVTDIDDGSISPPPSVSNDFTANFLSGIASYDEKVILLLDIVKMVAGSMF